MHSRGCARKETRKEEEEEEGGDGVKTKIISANEMKKNCEWLILRCRMIFS